MGRRTQNSFVPRWRGGSKTGSNAQVLLFPGAARDLNNNSANKHIVRVVSRIGQANTLPSMDPDDDQRPANSVRAGEFSKSFNTSTGQEDLSKYEGLMKNPDLVKGFIFSCSIGAETKGLLDCINERMRNDIVLDVVDDELSYKLGIFVKVQDDDIERQTEEFNKIQSEFFVESEELDGLPLFMLLDFSDDVQPI